jgi:hypothetical protein
LDTSQPSSPHVLSTREARAEIVPDGRYL